jgi:nicotinate-nucleotide adenylyltransferase
MRKMGIFGGTFDPVHWGHLLIAESAFSQMALTQVIWVPNPSPHYRKATPFEHRWEMVQRAITDHPGFTIYPSLANSSTPAYAIHTLTQLQAIYPNTHWYWILGLDTFQTLPRWYRRRELVAACDWLVAPRFESSVPEQEQAIAESQLICNQVEQKLAAEAVKICWQRLHMPGVGISASLIRQYCRDRRSIRYLVPEPVRMYIDTHNLYCE